MKKKALSLLLSVLLCALLLPVMATAAPTGRESMPASGCPHESVNSEGKCESCGAEMAAEVYRRNGTIDISERYYATVAEAVQAVPTDGMVMLRTPLTKNIVLDTNKTYRFNTGTSGAENASISVTAGNVVLIGKFGTVSVGATANVEFFSYGTSIKCLTTTKSDLSGMLSDGWCFKTTDGNGNVTWHDNTCKDKPLYEVELDCIPLYSVSITPETVPTLTYGYDNAPTLTVNATWVDSFGMDNAPDVKPVSTDNNDVTYEWYIGSTPMRVNNSSFTFPKGKAAGTYTVTCVATKDGYSRKSNEVTVTVNPAKVTVRDFTIDEKPYDGSAVSPTTGDAGIALYAALSLSSLTGMALVHKKRK